MKILYILPHCSTGGMPQYVLKLIEETIKEHHVEVVEVNNVSDDYVVQRNKIKEIVPFHQLFGNQQVLLELIQGFDVIHFQEIPETFIDISVLNKLYRKGRKYDIVVTTHSSYTDPAAIRWTADRFVLVSQWSKKKFEQVFPGMCEIWEYPIETINYNKEQAKDYLGWDKSYKHVLHVGLFTPGKNQKELIEIAKLCTSEKILFHFIGNQAPNFEDYWGPLMKDLPSNCIIHGEVNNPEDYYKASDLFYFPSLFELNPLAVKEALSFGLPVMLRKLDTYEDVYDADVIYISNSAQDNRDTLVKILEVLKLKIEIIHLLCVPTDEREIKSVRDIKPLKKYGITYTQIINPPYDGPAPKEHCRRPEDIGDKSRPLKNGLGVLTGRNYGNYRAHVDAISSIDESQYNYTLIFEGDASVELDTFDFVKIIVKACYISTKEDSPYVSLFYNPDIEASAYDDDFYLTGYYQVAAHAYLFSNKNKQWYLDRVVDCPWDGYDVWLNAVFYQHPRKRFMPTKMISDQHLGPSVIDPPELEQDVVVILGHCNTPYRKKLLKDCIKSFDGYTKVYCTNHPVEENIQKELDYVLYTKENPLLFKEEYFKYNYSYNYYQIDADGVRHDKPYDFDHSYAVYTLLKKAAEFAKGLGKTNVHIVNYDYLINKQTLIKHSVYLKFNQLVVYSYEDGEYDNCSFSTGFFSANVDALIAFCNHYKTMDDYYKDSGFVLEQKFYNILTNNGYKLHINSFKDLEQLGNKTNQEGLLEFANSLNKVETEFEILGREANTDKVTNHEYYKVYPFFTNHFRYESFNLFEIGIDQGCSYKLWENYYPNANIYGLDISTSFKTDRGEVFQGDQSNLETLKHVCQTIYKCKLIIDDGSHVPEHQLKTFYYLFENLLEDGGVYVIEDVECNYWHPQQTIYGYETGYLNIVDYFTKLNHLVNTRYNGYPNPLGIESVSFFPNCIVITKTKK